MKRQHPLVVSTNTGTPAAYEFAGTTVFSSMRRQPTVDGLQIFFDRVVGDEFAGQKIHGVKEAVVYAFSAAVFADLSRLYTQSVGPGHVGENLTMDELTESDFLIGDEYEVGETRLRVSGPRYPCNRLNFCFQRKNAMELFTEYRRPGVYFEVLQEGRVLVGDELKLVKHAGGDLSVLQLFDHLTALKRVGTGTLLRSEVIATANLVVGNPLVPELFRARFRKIL